MTLFTPSLIALELLDNLQVSSITYDSIYETIPFTEEDAIPMPITDEDLAFGEAFATFIRSYPTSYRRAAGMLLDGSFDELAAFVTPYIRCILAGTNGSSSSCAPCPAA